MAGVAFLLAASWSPLFWILLGLCSFITAVLAMKTQSSLRYGILQILQSLFQLYGRSLSFFTVSFDFLLNIGLDVLGQLDNSLPS